MVELLCTDFERDGKSQKQKWAHKKTYLSRKLEQLFRNEGLWAPLEIIIFFVVECCRSMRSGSEVK